MSTTIRIQAHQVKVGDVQVFNGGNITRRVTNTYVAADSIVITYADGWVLTPLPEKVVTIELPDTHPIAVLERMRERVEEQRKANHQEWLEAVRIGDEGRKLRRQADGKLLQGKEWGLGYAIGELRAGIEYYPGKG